MTREARGPAAAGMAGMAGRHRPSYRDAGVDIEAGELAVEAMRRHVAAATRPEVVGSLGGFAGLFALDVARYRRPLLASSTDGVGTKIAIARAMGVHDTIGVDLVAMVVDDLVVCGAEPLFLLDYIACGSVVPERVAAIVSGIAAGCVQAGCALVGGETAEHPGLMGRDDYDLAATGVGVVEADAVLGPDRVRAGDVVVAMPSSGLHSNGFSLVRHILAGLGEQERREHRPPPEAGGDLAAPAVPAVPAGPAKPPREGRDIPDGRDIRDSRDNQDAWAARPPGVQVGQAAPTWVGLDPAGLDRAGLDRRILDRYVDELGTSLGAALLTPTRIYARDCLALAAADAAVEVHAFAHITGGGLAANLARVIPDGLVAVLDRSTWTPPPIFQFLADRGGLDPAEMERTFNQGIGMVAVVPAAAAGTTLDILAERGVPSWVVGEVSADPTTTAGMPAAAAARAADQSGTSAVPEARTAASPGDTAARLRVRARLVGTHPIA